MQPYSLFSGRKLANSQACNQKIFERYLVLFLEPCFGLVARILVSWKGSPTRKLERGVGFGWPRCRCFPVGGWFLLRLCSIKAKGVFVVLVVSREEALGEPSFLPLRMLLKCIQL